MKRALLATLAILALAGCSAEPSWARRGSGIYDENGAETAFGVGVARGIKNESQRRSVAEDRARGELARALQERFAGAGGAFATGLVAGASVAARAYDAASNTEWALVTVKVAEAEGRR